MDQVEREHAPLVPAAHAAETCGALAAAGRHRIDKRGGSARRCGRWVVPRRLELRSSGCDVMLDFTDAVITRDMLRIDMDVRGGSLILLVRPGTVVDAGSLAVRDTEVMLGPSAEPDAQAILRVQLAGRMCYGQVEARWRGFGP